MSEHVPGSLELAYLGDTLYDLYVRERLVRVGGRVKDLNRQAVRLVCAKAQSQALGRIEPMLSEAEADVVRRARNAKHDSSGSADPVDYHRATAIEALMGYLYLSNQKSRMDALMAAALSDSRTDEEENPDA